MESEEEDWLTTEKEQRIQAMMARIAGLYPRAYASVNWRGYVRDEIDDEELLYELFCDYDDVECQPSWKLQLVEMMSDDELIRAIRRASRRAAALKLAKTMSTKQLVEALTLKTF